MRVVRLSAAVGMKVFAAFTPCYPAGEGATPSYTLKRRRLLPVGGASSGVKRFASGSIVFGDQVRSYCDSYVPLGVQIGAVTGTGWPWGPGARAPTGGPAIS